MNDKARDVEKLLETFESDDRDSLTKDELVILVDCLLNWLAKMHSDSHKALEVIKDIPCKEYRVLDIPNKPYSKALCLYYEVSNDFIKNELDKYDFHVLHKKEELS